LILRRHPLLLAPLLLAACAPGVGPRRGGAPPAPPLRPVWRVNLADSAFFPLYRPEEGTGPVVLPDGMSVAVGARDGLVRRVAVRDGSVGWTYDAGGPLQGRLTAAEGRLYLASDAGAVCALDVVTGREVWRQRTPGAVAAGPVVHEGRLFYVTDEERLRALDATTGKWLWDYSRDRPDRYVLHGAAEPVVAGGRLLAGFADGTLVALVVDDGSLVWSADLAQGAEQFTDVDGGPVVVGDRVFAASSAGGLHALELTDGTPVWRTPVEGARSPGVDGDSLLVPTSEGVLLRVDAATGRVRYRVRLTEEGRLGRPSPVGRWWAVPAPAAGLLLVDPLTGHPFQRIDPGDGVDSAPAVAGGLVVVLSNGGWLYGYRLASG